MREDPRVSSHLGHILSDNVEAALLLHDHPQQLHQVAVSELPAQRRRAQGREQEGTEATSIHTPHPITISRVSPSSPPPPQPYSRHHGRFCQESLRCGVIFNALDGDFVPPVITQHHICAEGWMGAGMSHGLPEPLPISPPYWDVQGCASPQHRRPHSVGYVQPKPFSPPNSPLPMICSSLRSFMLRAQPPEWEGGR